jgi:uncharacterized protein DUF4266
MRIGIVLLVLAATAGVGCATVRPQDKEFLADPVMALESRSIAAAAEQHVLDNREGSFGGTSASGGGCGCN